MRSIAIAGGGIIGLSCAWRLAQRGWQVTVFDAGRIANEASHAAAGMLAPGGEIDSDAALAAMALRSLRMYPEFVRDLEVESGFSVEYRPCGAIEIPVNEQALPALREKAARQAAIGIHSETHIYKGGAALRYPFDASVDPLSVNEALAAACRERGVSVREHETVDEIVDDGRGVRTLHGTTACDHVLIAAGAWSSSLMPGLPRSYPVRGHLLYFEMEPGLVPSILRSGHTYVLQRESGGVIAGSSMEQVGYDRTPDPAVLSDIHRRAATLVPELADLTPIDSWIGFRPAVDGAPVIGRVDRTQVWTAYGHFRNGILLAPETAERIAEDITAS